MPFACLAMHALAKRLSSWSGDSTLPSTHYCALHLRRALQPWQTLLPDLMAAAAEESPVAPAGKQRALRAIKHVLQALKSERQGLLFELGCCASSWWLANLMPSAHGRAVLLSTRPHAADAVALAAGMP